MAAYRSRIGAPARVLSVRGTSRAAPGVAICRCVDCRWALRRSQAPQPARKDLRPHARQPAAAAHRPRPPGRRVEQGRRHHGPLRRRRPRGHGRHLHGRGSGQRAEPRDGPARGAGEHDRDPPRGDGARGEDPRGAAPLAGLHRLRPPRGRPEAAAARGLLRARRRREGHRPAGRRDPRVPARTSSSPTTRTAATRTPTTSRRT